MRVEHELNLAAYWRDLPSLPPVSAEAPTLRKRMVLREKPARMIDDALRRRAFEAVGRAVSTTSPRRPDRTARPAGFSQERGKRRAARDNGARGREAGNTTAA